MSTCYDQFHRCFRHPQQRLVGVCSSCLQERLFLLLESLSPRDASNLQLASSLKDTVFLPDASNGCAHKITLIHERSLPPSAENLQKNGNGMQRPASTGPSPYEQMPTMRTHLAKHAHRPSDVTELLVRPPNQGHGSMKAAIGTSSGHGEKRVDSMGTEVEKSASPQQINGGLHDRGRKKKSSWFSMPKLKKSLPNSADDRNLSRNHGRSSSWISSFFHRRKWVQAKSTMTSSTSSVTDVTMDTTSEAIIPNGAHHHTPKNSDDIGRLSCDAARPNFKQLLKRMEARNKRPRADVSPSLSNSYAYRDKGHKGPSLQKSKSVTSSRASTCEEVHDKLMQTSPSRMLPYGHGNVPVGMEYESLVDERNLTRSRSWSRTWTRVLSPLRSHRPKQGVYVSPSSACQNNHYLQVGYITPGHGSFKEPSVCAPTPCSSHLSPSPLRRSSLASSE